MRSSLTLRDQKSALAFSGETWKLLRLSKGASVELTTLEVSMDSPSASLDGPHRTQVDYASIAKSLSVGSVVLLDDGLLALRVTDIEPSGMLVTYIELTKLDLPVLMENDREICNGFVKTKRII